MRAPDQSEPLFKTDDKFVTRQRILYWVTAIFVPPLLFALIAIRGDWSIAALFFAATCLVMLLKGYRSVNGLAVYEWGIRIITPLSVADFAWDEVKVRGYDLFHRLIGQTEIHVKALFFPYLLEGFWFGQGKPARKALLAHYKIVKIRSGS